MDRTKKSKSFHRTAHRGIREMEEERIQKAKSRALDAEWDARSKLLGWVAVVALVSEQGMVGQEDYYLGRLRDLYREYEHRQRERQEM